MSPRDEHGHERHERLSRPHVALQQAVHLLSASHVLPYFPNHTLLCSGKREGQVFMVERVEVLADVAEHISAVLPSVVVGVSENVQLHVEQFFELQSQPCLLSVFGTFRIVNFPKGIISGYQVERSCDKRRERLRQWLCEFFQQVFHDFLHRPRCDTRLFHRFCRHVIRLHAHGRQLHVFRLFDFRVRKLVAPAIDGGSSEDDIVFLYRIVSCDILRPREPNQIDYASAVGEIGNHPFLAGADREFLEAENLSANLHERHVGRQLVDAIDTAPVNMFVGEIFQQIAISADLELFLQNLLSRRADPRDILHILIQYIKHRLFFIYR